jgi:hypothetical protein
MKVDVANSAYRESPEAKNEFNRKELRRCRLLLRRLRFLEQQIRETGGLENGGESGGAAFAEWEVEALEWILADIGFLATRVSGNRR